MSQHFHIWRDKKTIQGLWPNCIWKDKQNQGKGLVLEPKTRKLKCILHRNSSLDFFQNYTSRRVAFLCIFSYMMSYSSEFHRTFAKNGTDALFENLLVAHLWEGLGYLQCLYRRRFRRPCVHCFGVRFAGTLRLSARPLALLSTDRPFSWIWM